MGPEEHFHCKIFEASLETFQLFRIVFGVSVTTAKNFNQGWQNCKKCLEEQTKGKLVSKEKKLLFQIFQGLERSFNSIFSEKLPAWFSKLQPTYLSKILRLNNFWKIAQCFNLLLSLRFKKIRAFSHKDIFGVFTTRYHASTGISWERVISRSKLFLLPGIFFGDWTIS